MKPGACFLHRFLRVLLAFDFLSLFSRTLSFSFSKNSPETVCCPGKKIGPPMNADERG
jgi:hypothetical protein